MEKNEAILKSGKKSRLSTINTMLLFIQCYSLNLTAIRQEKEMEEMKIESECPCLQILCFS